MKLSEEIKTEIYREYNDFRNKLYAGKSLEERKDLDQFFTPPELTIQMIEKMNCDDLSDKNILDPTCGSGNLLVACLIAGADYRNLFGNDYDDKMQKIAKKRIRAEMKYLGIETNEDESHYGDILSSHIHCGNALQRKCITDFGSGYDEYLKAIKRYPKLKDDLTFAQKNYDIPNQYLYVQVSLFD